MNLQHIAVKLFVNDASGFDMAALIPIFHGWIQRTALSDLMLFDVADYTHVHEGPGVMLICHEGHFAMDEGDGRLGLLYCNKRLAEGSVQERLRTALGRAFAAAKLLEDEPDLAGKFAFACDELLFRIDDRLVAPNTAETFDRLRPDLEQVLAEIYNGAPVELRRIEIPDTGLTIAATVMTSLNLETIQAHVTSK